MDTPCGVDFCTVPDHSMSEPFRFVAIGSGQQFIACAERLWSRGHRLLGVTTDCRDVRDWCTARNVPQTDDLQVAIGWMANRSCDYLLSIVNHRIVPAEMLAGPTRGAINYHDSLLPAYAGFNATSWAIMEGQQQHGVTWHLMTADADAGPVLLQQRIEIRDDDTAFTLGVKCSEAGVASFAALLTQLEEQALQPRAQQGAASVHTRSERPGAAILDFTRPARELTALVRALDLGTEDNWMATPKAVMPGGYLSVTEARSRGRSRSAPGSVVNVSLSGLEIATSDDDLLLSGLFLPDGEAVDAIQAAERFGLRLGQPLPALDTTQRTRIERFDREVTRSERFWVDRLASLKAASLPGLPAHHVPEGPLRVIRRRDPLGLAAFGADHRDSVLAAAWAVFIYRLGGGDTFDIAAAAAIPEHAPSLYAEAVPARFQLSDQTTFNVAVEQTASELQVIRTRGAYARDVRLRYCRLRGRNASSLRLPLGFLPGSHGQDVADAPVRASCPDALVTLISTLDGGYGWAYDETAFSTAAALALADRFEVLLAGALDDSTASIATLPLLPAAEREQLLVGWQGEQRVYDSDACVHQFVERQVERTPDVTAVVFGDEWLSYRALNDRANALAGVLRSAGVGPEILVGICVERSLDMVVALLGVLKAGGAYVPMDPAYPTERLALMLEDSRAPIVITQRHLTSLLPASGVTIVLVDRTADCTVESANPVTGVTSAHLAYVIFTSGSTGRPKGTMLEHRNVANFFEAMDAVLAPGTPAGVWLAVTSISFDISVLELFWALARGFKVVIAPEANRAAIDLRSRAAYRSAPAMEFGLFYFAADSADVSSGDAYRLLLEGAKFADTHGFAAVWTPERHFHAFGGLYPNPAVTTAALSTITRNVQLRAGSIVLPLHNPLRVAEDWAVIDQLSHGRVGLSFASGWHVNDFAFMPEHFENRRDVMVQHIDTVMKLWRGEAVAVPNGAGDMINVSVLPRPVQAMPPIWIASAGSVETFVLAGRMGANVLTNMLGQDLADLTVKFAAYRQARREHGHDGDGIISVMLHTFVCESTDEARALARKPFADYLATSFDLVKVAPKMFPAFRQPSQDASSSGSIDSTGYTAEDMSALLEHAFDRYFDTAGLFGTPERALDMVDQLSSIGANEVACLIDFGIETEKVLASLPHLWRLQELCRTRAASAAQDVAQHDTIAELIDRHGVTHLQCTPSIARVLASDPVSLGRLATLDTLLLGGEALPADLATRLSSVVRGRLLNMYGPTETTVWSTTSEVRATEAPTIGRPIANTTIRVLDANRQLVPIGVDGELFIGGAGVARGYLNREDLTADRFIPDPWMPGASLYSTGDLVRHRRDGALEFLGRLDHQVKISGHRVELAEIEQTLSQHPSVREAVVVARPATAASGTPSLVAYVVTSRDQSVGARREASVEGWQHVWNETYRTARNQSHAHDSRFRIAGWTDSHTGHLIPVDQMRAWRDATIARLRALAPTRVLEIGCGTGLVLFPLLPYVEHYTGLDIAQEALDSIRHELTPDEARKVVLSRLRADEIDLLAGQSFDLVVINSVAQYFPDADYLARVLQRAAALVVDHGHVFVGDVRSLDHLRAFSTSVELVHTPDHASLAELRERIEQRMSRESELLVSESFFHAVARDTPRIGDVTFALKAERTVNELTNFRYDVVLHVGAQDARAQNRTVPAHHVDNLDDVRLLLSQAPDLLHLVDMPNARLSDLLVAEAAISQSAPLGVTHALRTVLSTTARYGVDPSDLYSISDDYVVESRWSASGDPLRFDAALRRRAAGDVGGWPGAVPVSTAPPSTFANMPAATGTHVVLSSLWREHLSRRLPEYMVPSVFVELTALPLTPNGKIDRNALPAPVGATAKAIATYTPPGNELEQQIAQIWRTLLAIERVGRQDNIFDLGANSLLTMQANNQLSSVLGRKVSLVSMFRFPTVASLAEHLRQDVGAAPSDPSRVDSRVSRTEQAALRRRALRAAQDDT